MAEPDQTRGGPDPPSSPEEDTYEEKRRGERNDEEFEAVRHTRLREPDGIPPISVTRGYGAHEPIDDYRYEYVGEKTWDISGTMPLEGNGLEDVVDGKVTERLNLLEAIKFKKWAACRSLTTPAACREADGYGRLPLLVALLGGAPTDIALGLLSANPEASAKPDSAGDLLLHLAINLQLELRLVQALHDANPEAARAKGEFGELPLHLVLQQSKAKVLTEEPEPEPEAEADGELPWWATAQSFVKTLGAERRGVDLEEHAAQSLSDLVALAGGKANEPPAPAHGLGRTDLSMEEGEGVGFCEWQLGVVQMLLSSHAPGALQTCGNGKLPLHIAAEARAQSAVVILLLEIIAAKPAACQLAHAASLDLPIHLALARAAPDALVAKLLVSLFRYCPRLCSVLIRGCGL